MGRGSGIGYGREDDTKGEMGSAAGQLPAMNAAYPDRILGRLPRSDQTGGVVDKNLLLKIGNKINRKIQATDLLPVAIQRYRPGNLPGARIRGPSSTGLRDSGHFRQSPRPLKSAGSDLFSSFGPRCVAKVPTFFHSNRLIRKLILLDVRIASLQAIRSRLFASNRLWIESNQ